MRYGPDRLSVATRTHSVSRHSCRCPVKPSAFSDDRIRQRTSQTKRPRTTPRCSRSSDLQRPRTLRRRWLKQIRKRPRPGAGRISPLSCQPVPPLLATALALHCECHGMAARQWTDTTSKVIDAPTVRDARNQLRAFAQLPPKFIAPYDPSIDTSRSRHRACSRIQDCLWHVQWPRGRAVAPSHLSRKTVSPLCAPATIGALRKDAIASTVCCSHGGTGDRAPRSDGLLAHHQCHAADRRASA